MAQQWASSLPDFDSGCTHTGSLFPTAHDQASRPVSAVLLDFDSRHVDTGILCMTRPPTYTGELCYLSLTLGTHKQESVSPAAQDWTSC